jgi:hypothetical protein
MGPAATRGSESGHPKCGHGKEPACVERVLLHDLRSHLDDCRLEPMTGVLPAPQPAANAAANRRARAIAFVSLSTVERTSPMPRTQLSCRARRTAALPG